MANKKRYVTYAPYHEEYLLYPCTFRGPDYTCNNPDAPRYTRTCYAKYRCKYDRVDPTWFKKYQEVQERNQKIIQNLEKTPDTSIVPDCEPRTTINDIPFRHNHCNPKYLDEIYKMYCDWPRSSSFYNRTTLDQYRGMVRRTALCFRAASKCKRKSENYTKLLNEAKKEFQSTVDYVTAFILVSRKNGMTFREMSFRNIVSKKNIQCIYNSLTQITDAEVDNAIKIYVKHLLAGLSFDNTKKYDFYG